MLGLGHIHNVYHVLLSPNGVQMSYSASDMESGAHSRFEAQGFESTVLTVGSPSPWQ
jgi:hypothetical protein